MTTQPPLSPSDAPFVANMVPSGWDRPMTQEEADAANLLYPVPPYGDTYFPPAPPPVAQRVQFVKLTNIMQGVQTTARVRPEDIEFLPVNRIFVVWPLAGVLGIVDDVGTRPVRVMQVVGDEVTINYDSTGLDVTGLELLGVVYVGP